MLEYIDASGQIYTEDQINKMAAEQKTSASAIIKSKGLKKKTEETKVSTKKYPWSEPSKSEQIDNFSYDFKKDKRKPKKTEKISPVDIEKANVELVYPAQEEKFSIYSPEYLNEQREKESILASKKRLEDATIISSLNDSKIRVDEQQIEEKSNTYGNKLGNLIWASEDDLKKPEVYQTISAITSPDGMTGKIAPMLNGELQDTEYAGVEDGQFIVNNLPRMQQAWIIENGEAARALDLNKKVNTREKSLSNGRKFLDYGERELVKKIAC